MSANKVIVVGAGCAGLSATYTLMKAGIDVLCLEATNVYGGRCRNHKEGGYNFPAGAAFTEPQWHTTQQYVKEFGLLSLKIPKFTFAYKKNNKYYPVLIGGIWEMVKFLPNYLKLGFGVFPFKTFFQLIKLGMQLKKDIKGVDYANHKYDTLIETSNISTAEYVTKYGGWETMNYIFHPYTATMILARPQDIAAAHPIALFSLMKGMSGIVGGLGEITTALYNQVKDCVKFNTPIKKIVIKDNKVVGVEAEDGFIEADHVICAVDAQIARKIIPDAPAHIKSTLEKCTYSSSFDCQFIVKKKLDIPPNVQAIMIPQNDETILSTIFVGRNKDYTNIVGFTRGWMHEELTMLDQDTLAYKVMQDIRKYIPDFPDKTDYTKIFRWDRAVNLEAPGQFNAVQDLLQNHMDDVEGLHLAGEYLFLVACTEGALLTGKEAAEKAIDSLGMLPRNLRKPSNL